MKPDHYGSVIDVYDYVLFNNIGPLEMNIIKYVSRWRKKGGLEDLDKARETLDRLISFYLENGSD